MLATVVVSTGQASSFASGVTYTGRIMKGDEPINSGTVRFYLWIQTQNGCDLYAEQRDVDMTGSDGTYSFEIGTGASLSSFPHSAHGIQNLSDVFDNSKTTVDLDTSRTGCISFAPTSDEGRVMKVQFLPPGEVAAQALPDLNLTAVPTAMQAFNAAKIGGYGTGDMIRIDPTVTKTTHPNTDLTQTQYDEFWNLILGTSTTYLKAIPTLGGDVTGTLPAMKVIKIQNYDVDSPAAATSGNVLTYNGTKMVWQAVSTSGGITSLNGLTSATQSFASGTSALTISSSGSTHTLSIANAGNSSAGLLSSSDWNTFNGKQSSSLAAGQVWIGNASGGAEAQILTGDIASVSASGVVTLSSSASGSNKLPLAGGTMSGAIAMGGNDITNAGNVSLANNKYFGLSNYATGTGTTAGQIWFDGANVKYFDGTTAKTLGAAGALTSGDVTTALGYTPVNRAGDTMTGDLTSLNLNITAGKFLGLGAGSTAGTVAGQMWYDSGVIKYFDGTSARSLGVAGSGITSLNGLTSGTQSFVIDTNGTSPQIVSAGSAHTLSIPMASTSAATAGLISNADYAAFVSKLGSGLAAGQMWVGNASGAAQAFTLSGDVSSVSNTGSVVVNKTTTGTSNTILALDGSSVANAYGFGVKGSVSGTVMLQAAATTSAYSLKLPSTTPVANQIMQSDASGNLSWVTNTASSGYVNGGNTFAGNATIGLNDAYTLGFKTSGTTQMTLDANGKLGIGTATPTAALDVTGAVNINGTNGLSYPSTDSTAGASVAIGASALVQQSSLASAAYRNTAVGYQAMNNSGLTTAATKNTALGYKAGAAITSGYQNTFIGYTSGASSGAARTSTAIGANATVNAGSSGYDVVVVGANSSCCAGGTAGVVIGASSTGSNNGGIAIGNAVSEWGDASISIGSNSATGDYYAIAIGGTAKTSSSSGIAIGASTGSINVTGVNNVLIGSGVGSTTLTTGARNLLIGVDNSVTTVAAATNNSMNIGNALYATNMKNATNTSGVAKIGINTNAPAYVLDMNGSTDAIRLPAGTTAQQPSAAAGLLRYNTDNSNLEFNNGSSWTALSSGGASGYVNGGNSFTGNATIGLNDNYTLTVETANTARMVFMGNGDIGIGTAAPKAHLHIKDSTATGASYSAFVIGDDTGTHVGYDFDGLQAYNNTSNSILYLNYWGGDIGFGDGSKVKFNRTTNNLEGNSGGGVKINNAGTITTNSGAISSTSGNIYTTSGKMGVGAAPSYSFDAGSNTDAIRLPKGTTAQQPANAAGLLRYNSTNSNLEFNNGTTWTSLASSSGSAGAYVNGGNSFGATATIGLSDNYNLGIKTNGTTRMTVDKVGNIGLGTTSPSYQFHLQDPSDSNRQIWMSDVSSDMLNIQSAELGYTGITFINVGGSNWGMGAGPAGTGSPYAPDMGFTIVDHIANAARMAIDGNGNLGVDTLTPMSTLDVNGNAVVRTVGTANWNEGLSIARSTDSDYSWTSWHTGTASDAVPSSSDIDFGLGQNAGEDAFYLVAAGMTTSNLGRQDAAFKVERSTGDIYFGGKIGLRTTNPLSALQLGENTGSANPQQIFLSEAKVSGGGRPLITGQWGAAGLWGIGPATAVGDNIVRIGNVNALDTDWAASQVTILNAPFLAINTTSPNGSARVDITDTSTATSAILVPRAGTFTGTPANGMIRYNTSTNLFEFYQNGSWRNYTVSSDRRLKTNIEPLTQGLDIVNQLNPVYFDWDQNTERGRAYGTKHQVGFVAQEVEKVLPEVVNKGADTYRTMEYDKVVSVVVAAVKELYQKVIGVDRRVASLEAENEKLQQDNVAKDKELADMRSRLERLEKRLDQGK